jgi:2-methylcitrate dehydratase PrpD
MTTHASSPDGQERQFARSLLKLSTQITPALQSAATRHIIDYIGVTLAGMSTEPVRRARDGLAVGMPAAGSGHGGLVLGEGDARRMPVEWAIFFNTMAGHIHDFDDDETLLSIAHVTVPVTAAAWTLGEAKGVSGDVIVAAYVTGVEAMMRLGQMVNPEHYRQGWHSSTTLGVFGSAVASAIVLGFDEDQLLNALRFAASMAAGMRTSFGSDAKSLQLAQGARNGYTAALFAGAGLIASEGMLFGSGGFVALYHGGTERIGAAVAAIGQPAGLLTPGVTIKAFPCCTATHTAIEATLMLTQEHAIAWPDIEQIVVTMGSDLPSVLIYDRPRTGLEAKFSMRYCAAAAARFGRMGIDEFTDAATQDSAVQTMLDRTIVNVDHDTHRPSVGLADHAHVAITMKHGAVFQHQFPYTLGSVQRPISNERLSEKFLACASPAIGETQARALCASLFALADATDIAVFVRAMS